MATIFSKLWGIFLIFSCLAHISNYEKYKANFLSVNLSWGCWSDDDKNKMYAVPRLLMTMCVSECREIGCFLDYKQCHEAILLLVSTYWRSCQRSWGSLIANVSENVKQLSFWCTQSSWFWLKTIATLTVILKDKQFWKHHQMSEMEVAPRYTLLTLFTL